jgi:hypothetical protein
MTVGALLKASGTPSTANVISPQGTVVSSNGTGISSLGVSPLAVGDALVLGVKVFDSTNSVTSVTGGGATWTKITASSDSAQNRELELWLGTVTSTGPSAINVAYANPVSSTMKELASQEYTNTTAAGCPANSTELTLAAKPVPLMVTVLPPFGGPRLGWTEVTTGAAPVALIRAATVADVPAVDWVPVGDTADDTFGS